MKQTGLVLLSLVMMSLAACGAEEVTSEGGAGEESAEWVCEGEVCEERSSALVATWYDSGSRKIYARASQFRGTPNVKMTSRAVAGGACRTTGPVVMSRVARNQESSTLCARVGLTFGPVSGGGSGCRTSNSSTHVDVMVYNFTSPTQTQLNYNVFDFGNGRVLDQSGWQPGGAGNGCPRAIP